MFLFNTKVVSELRKTNTHDFPGINVLPVQLA
jgi:hypothetical protein